jgi:hypothetical protein
MSEVRWHFPVNGGGLAAGFNDSSIDHFKGHRLSSLVREVIQNSIDARRKESEPVVVDFQFSELQIDALPQISALTEHFKWARSTAEVQNSEQAIEFYDEAIRTVNQRELPVLVIHDSNTMGLTGPLEGPNGAWYALTKGSGLTQKKGPSSLGSFGHGSKAPFASSKLRTIFYLSKIDSGECETELRFQGKSTLQSYALPFGEMTQGTGFYGEPDRCQPLKNEMVPDWALKLRNDRTDQTGTSIIIPGAIWNQKSIDSVTITAIANFFYAIWKGVLEVQVGSVEKLTATNIVERYKNFKPRLSEVFEEIDMEAISDSFETIETIVNSTQHGEQQIQTFGRVDWYFRVGEDVDSRNVAVARGNGMLITKRAPNLIKFPNLKPFDFFVCVTGNGGDGSELLKSIENPEHTNFEFDRIDDPKKRTIAKKKYDTFHRTVREILKRYASYSTSDQIVVDDLQDLFNDISDDIDSPGGSVERGSKIQIATGGLILKRREDPSQTNTHDPDGKADELPGAGLRGGHKKAQSKGGTLPGKTGPAVIIGPSAPRSDGPEPPKVVPLRNLRMRSSPSRGCSVTLFFDTPFSGAATLKLTKAGEIGGEPLLLLVNKTPTSSVDIVLTNLARTEITVELAEKSVNFAIEGEAYEIKS